MIHTITVTEEHIKLARDWEKAKYPGVLFCPVDFAVFDEMGASPHPWITNGNNLSQWSDSKEKIEVPLPTGARHFVTAFDQGKEVQPFSFEIDLPEEDE